MSLVSLPFAGFVLACLAVYYLAPARTQPLVLLLASLAYCGTWAWQFPIVLLSICAFNFAGALSIAPDRHPSRVALPICIAVDIAALLVLKYGGWLGTGDQPADVLVPVGISFYTLSAISYLVDVSRGQVPPVRSFVEFALFLAYFPKLLAGPIERARAFVPQLGRARVIDNELLARSLALILLGLVRKLVIADTIASRLGEYVFRQPQSFSSLELAVAVVGYLFLLYNDFAGYTDLARGVSGLFGIELAPNFRAPLLARSFGEFWGRWHITLSHWVRDYVFLPLSRTLLRRDPRPSAILNVLLPPVVTMLVSGLWHGVRPALVIWGALMGVFLVVERVAPWTVGPRRQVAAPWAPVASRAFFLAGLVVAAVPFRMEWPIAVEFWRGLFAFRGAGIGQPVAVAAVGALAVLSLAIDLVQRRTADELAFLGWPRPMRSALVAAALLALFLATRAELARDFVYQGF